jgi:microcystin-dependent protein
MSDPFVAEVKIFAGNFAPRGWAFCNGQLLPISQNTALFSLIGTTYGGDGRTTTALPNMQERAPMHPGTGPGLTTRRLGERGGVEEVTMTAANMPSHSHALLGSVSPASTNAPGSDAASASTLSRSVGGNAFDNIATSPDSSLHETTLDEFGNSGTPDAIDAQFHNCPGRDLSLAQLTGRDS